jgi:RNA polymerase sigma-70 factor (ECF subfamily)
MIPTSISSSAPAGVIPPPLRPWSRASCRASQGSRRACSATPVEAEDVAQETFLRAWKQAPMWKEGSARFDTWLHRVALNLCYDRLRRRREQPTAEPPEQTDPGAAPDRGLLAADVGRRVAAALEALPERQREAVVLCHYQELGNIEAAGVMEVSVEALESLLARGRRSLRAALKDLVEE